MTEKELSHLTKLIKEVSLSPDADEKIALILKMASESITDDKIKGLVDKDDKRKVKSGILKFSKKEIDKMPTSLKNLFAHNDMIVRYRYYKGLFQARYRKNGMNIEVASTDFNTMKRKFIAKLCEGQGDTVQSKQSKSTVKVADCAQAWLKLKEHTTKPSTYKEYLRRTTSIYSSYSAITDFVRSREAWCKIICSRLSTRAITAPLKSLNYSSNASSTLRQRTIKYHRR